MKLVKFFILIFVVIMWAGCDSEEEETKMILETFASYKTAILNWDGITAYAYVDSNTKQYYAEMLKNALHLSEYETKHLSLNNKIVVTMARHTINEQKLLEMDGESFFIYAVDHGWIGEESVSRLEIVVSEIDKTFAKTHILTQEGEAPFGLTFRKENGTWAIDLTSIMNITESVIEKQIEQLGISENDFVVAMLTKTSGSRPDSAIWQPIQ
jgi:hypothetical protein